MQRSSYKQANQRVAAPRVLEVACAQDRLSEAVQGLLDTWNSATDTEFEASLATKSRMMRWAAGKSSPNTRHYFLLQQPGHLMVTFGVRAALMAERGLKGYGEGWIAQIAPAGDSDGGATRIEVCLLKWSVDDDGRIWNGGRYVQMLDGLVEDLDGRYVSDPVNEEDHHFVKRS